MTDRVGLRPSRICSDAYTHCYESEHSPNGEVCWDCVQNAIREAIFAALTEAEQVVRSERLNEDSPNFNAFIDDLAGGIASLKNELTAEKGAIEE